MSNIRIEKNFIPLPDEAYTRVIEAGETMELRTLKNKPSMAGLQSKKRISKDTILDTETGELLQCNPDMERAKNPHLKETLKKIKLYIKENFQDSGQFITLTFRNGEYDMAVAKAHLQKFLGKLKKLHSLEYIWVVEPTEAGAWHFHLLVKGTELTEREVEQLWRHGEINIQDIYDTNGLACYLTPSVVTDRTETTPDVKDGIMVLSKAEQKSSRLKYYPARVRIYGKSNGIRRWKETKTTRGQAETLIADKKKTAEMSFLVVDEETEQTLNQFNVEVYKK